VAGPEVVADLRRVVEALRALDLEPPEALDAALAEAEEDVASPRAEVVEPGAALDLRRAVEAAGVEVGLGWVAAAVGAVVERAEVVAVAGVGVRVGVEVEVAGVDVGWVAGVGTDLSGAWAPSVRPGTASGWPAEA
jgi:hypothetical protein